jgi:vitamin B12 transporter
MTPTFFLFLAFHVRGVVVDQTARPVEGAKVVCDSETIVTNDRGEFDFASATRCNADISKDGFAARRIGLDDSKDQQVMLTLAATSDRVVVTATGAPVPIEEAGVSANVVTASDFAARGNSFLADYLRDIPGLSVVQTGRNGGLTSLFARGGDSSSTLVLLDGMPLTDPGGAINLVNLTTAGIDRMEVIRGPESALFGAEASSAVIQIFSKHGDAESSTPHGMFSYERGSFSTDHWTASMDGGWLKKIDYSFTADQFRTTGEFPNDAFRITTGSANIGYHFSDNTSLHAIFREYDSYTGAPGQVYYGLTDYLANETDRDSTISLRLDDARGKRFVQHAMFGYHRLRDTYTDNTGEIDYTIAALIRTVPASPAPLVYLVKLVSVTTTAAPPGTTLVQETASVFGGDDLSITERTDAGYQGAWTHAGGALVFGYQFDRQAGVVSGTNIARYDNGFFVNDQYAVTPRILLSGGVRLQQSSTFGTEFAPRGAVTFRFPTDTFLRVSASRGVTEPSLLENFAKESFYVGNPSLKPETTASYEVGVYREWWRRRVRTDLAIFRNSFRDLITYDGSVFPGTWRNIDQSWARGGEISGTVRINRWIAVRAGYTRLYTRITESNAGDTGEQLPRQPLNSGTISLNFTSRKLTLLAGGRIVGERADSDFVFGVNRSPAYQYVFASGSWQATKHVAPFVRIENALDQVYQEALGYSSLSRTAMGGLRVTW